MLLGFRIALLLSSVSYCSSSSSSQPFTEQAPVGLTIGNIHAINPHAIRTNGLASWTHSFDMAAMQGQLCEGSRLFVNLEEDTGEMIVSHYQRAFVGVFRELPDKYKAVYPKKKVLLAKENLLPTGTDVTDHSVFVQENDIVFAVVPHVRDYVFKPIDLLGAVYGSGAEDHVTFEHWVNGLYHILKDTRATIVIGTVTRKDAALKSPAYRILHTAEFARNYSTFGPANGGGKQAVLSGSGNNIRPGNLFGNGWVTGILSQAPGPNWDNPSIGSFADSPLNGPLSGILSWSFADIPINTQQNSTAPPPPAARALAWSPPNQSHPPPSSGPEGHQSVTQAVNPDEAFTYEAFSRLVNRQWTNSEWEAIYSPAAGDDYVPEGPFSRSYFLYQERDNARAQAGSQDGPSAKPASQPTGSISGSEAIRILSTNFDTVPMSRINFIQLPSPTSPSWFHTPVQQEIAETALASSPQASSSPSSVPAAAAPQQESTESTAGVERTWSMAEYEQAMQQEPTVHQQPPVRRSERLSSQQHRGSQVALASKSAATASSARQTIPQDDVNEEDEEKEEPMSAPATRKSTRRHQDEPEFKRPRRE